MTQVLARPATGTASVLNALGKDVVRCVMDNIDKVFGEFVVQISKERLRCLFDELRLECLPVEESAFERDEYVTLSFSKKEGTNRVSFREVGREVDIVLSRD